MANPTPSLPPLLDEIAVLMPMTSPSRLTSGPPLLPGLIAASVWMKLFALAQADSAALGADDSRGHRAFQAERIAQGQHPIADFGVVAITQFRRREVIGARDPQHRQVGLGVGMDLGCLVLAAVVQADCDLAAVAHHVGVGENHSRGIDDQPGAQAAFTVPRGTRHVLEELPQVGHVAQRAAELPFERIVIARLLVLQPDGHGRFALDHHYRRLDGLGRLAEGLRQRPSGGRDRILVRTGHDRTNARQRCREQQPAHHRHDDGPKRPPIPYITFQKTHGTLLGDLGAARRYPIRLGRLPAAFWKRQLASTGRALLVWFISSTIKRSPCPRAMARSNRPLKITPITSLPCTTGK